MPIKLILKHTFLNPSSLVVLILGVALFIQALAVVYVKDKHRYLNILYHAQVKKQNALNGQWSQLLIERGTWGSAAHIERSAEGYLNMQLPKGQDVRIVPQ